MKKKVFLVALAICSMLQADAEMEKLDPMNARTAREEFLKQSSRKEIEQLHARERLAVENDSDEKKEELELYHKADFKVHKNPKLTYDDALTLVNQPTFLDKVGHFLRHAPGVVRAWVEDKVYSTEQVNKLHTQRATMQRYREGRKKWASSVTAKNIKDAHIKEKGALSQAQEALQERPEDAQLKERYEKLKRMVQGHWRDWFNHYRQKAIDAVTFKKNKTEQESNKLEG